MTANLSFLIWRKAHHSRSVRKIWSLMTLWQQLVNIWLMFSDWLVVVLIQVMIPLGYQFMPNLICNQLWVWYIMSKALKYFALDEKSYFSFNKKISMFIELKGVWNTITVFLISFKWKVLKEKFLEGSLLLEMLLRRRLTTFPKTLNCRISIIFKHREYFSKPHWVFSFFQ